eukprot:429473-Hanusia_phi.AAC.1
MARYTALGPYASYDRVPTVEPLSCGGIAAAGDCRCAPGRAACPAPVSATTLQSLSTVAGPEVDGHSTVLRTVHSDMHSDNDLSGELRNLSDSHDRNNGFKRHQHRHGTNLHIEWH